MLRWTSTRATSTATLLWCSLRRPGPRPPSTTSCSAARTSTLRTGGGRRRCTLRTRSSTTSWRTFSWLMGRRGSCATTMACPPRKASEAPRGASASSPSPQVACGWRTQARRTLRLRGPRRGGVLLGRMGRMTPCARGRGLPPPLRPQLPGREFDPRVALQAAQPARQCTHRLLLCVWGKGKGKGTRQVLSGARFPAGAGAVEGVEGGAQRAGYLVTRHCPLPIMGAGPLFGRRQGRRKAGGLNVTVRRQEDHWWRCWRPRRR
mmetsp:Transcript_4862/g.11213  ORF Transcript_4862/g.11213 Transcript_4862/m.11213 type:complete len:263 (+) Transcript_4862:570-1358(+)